MVCDMRHHELYCYTVPTRWFWGRFRVSTAVGRTDRTLYLRNVCDHCMNESDTNIIVYGSLELAAVSMESLLGPVLDRCLFQSDDLHVYPGSSAK